MRGHTVSPAPVSLAGVVEAVWDVDVPDAGQARDLRIKVLPSPSPVICIHYRSPILSERQNGQDPYAATLTGARTATGVLQPTGPIGVIAARIKPSAAARLFRCGTSTFADAHLDLTSLLPRASVVSLIDSLGEARHSAERLARFEQFLLSHIGSDQTDPLVDHAADELRANPATPIHRLAARLDLGERQFERRFLAQIGISPKQFARIERCERIFARRMRGSGWADIAVACGFTDQPHMVRDFKTLVGEAPDAFAKAVSAPARRALNTSLTMSGFYNTFVI